MGIKRLNISIFIDSELQSGGGFQYEYMVLDVLKRYHHDNNINLSFYSLRSNIIKDYKDIGLNIKIIKENFFQKIHRLMLSNIYLYKIFCTLGLGLNAIELTLKKDNIDLVYFLSPSLLSQALTNIPYIFTLWDLGHLEILEFPEVSHEKQFEFRELIYTKSLKKAFRVIVSSNYAKNMSVQKYNLDSDRVEVLNFLPNIRTYSNETVIDIKKKYLLKNEYIFYPAQFWAHKNHIYILKAIKFLKEEKNILIDVVFSGANKGNLEHILNKSKEYNIQNQVHYIGFAPNEEIPSLYKQSLALVMPTYLGPTNIPPLEAFAYCVPVCYSDKPFFREQLGDSVFYMDLNNPQSLVDHIINIRSNKQLTQEKIKMGIKVLNDWNDKDFYDKTLSMFNEYKYIREAWA